MTEQPKVGCADAAAERELFEAWISDKHASKLLMAYAWEGWQARAAISSAIPNRLCHTWVGNRCMYCGMTYPAPKAKCGNISGEQA